VPWAKHHLDEKGKKCFGQMSDLIVNVVALVLGQVGQQAVVSSQYFLGNGPYTLWLLR